MASTMQCAIFSPVYCTVESEVCSQQAPHALPCLYLCISCNLFNITQNCKTILSITTLAHCGYRRYYNQGLSHHCALVVAVRGGPLT